MKVKVINLPKIMILKCWSMQVQQTGYENATKAILHKRIMQTTHTLDTCINSYHIVFPHKHTMLLHTKATPAAPSS